MCLCVSVCEYAYMHAGWREPEEGLRSPGAGVIDSWGLPEVDAGT